MTNRVENGDSLDVLLTSTVNGGDPVAIGDLTGVAVSGGVSGDLIACEVRGVFLLPKAAGAGSGVAQGAKVYFDPAAGKITGTAGALKQAGWCAATAADGDTAIAVKLLG